MLDLKASYVWLKELIKNARTFVFSLIFFNILGAFHEQIRFQISTIKTDKTKQKIRAFGRTGTARLESAAVH